MQLTIIIWLIYIKIKVIIITICRRFLNDFKKNIFFEVHHGVILLNDSDGVVAATVVVLDIPVIAFITPLILFLAAIIIEVKLNTIINTKITITKIQIYLTNYSYDIYDGFDIYISFIKKIFFLINYHQ